MKTYVLYGLPDGPLEDYVQRLSSALGIGFTAHESSYRGVYYSSGPLGQEHFDLQPNYLPHEEEWMVEKYRDFPVLLYVNETTRADELDRLLLAVIPSARRLKREEL